jgi:hypothetical protein
VHQISGALRSSTKLRNQVARCMKHQNNMEHQDWTPVVVRARRGAGAAAKTEARPAVTAAVAQARRLENDELPKPKTLSAASRQQMIQGRVAHGMNQVQMNQACSFPPHTIRDIEAGKMHPSPAQLNTINVVLKLALKYE